MEEAKALPLERSCTVDRLDLVKIPGELIDWATGKRASIPGDCRALQVRAFRLGDGGA